MLYLLLSLILIGLLTAIMSKFSQHKNEEVVMPQNGSECATCSGENAKCEQDCMMEAAARDVEYYDDEELDRFCGRASDQYNDEEVEEFAEVLHTMRQEEVAGWCRSLTLRGIHLPDQLKDETVMLIDDMKRQ